jgi:hypothetical protein
MVLVQSYYLPVLHKNVKRRYHAVVIYHVDFLIYSERTGIDANFKRLVIDKLFELLRINTHSIILLVSMLAMDISVR